MKIANPTSIEIKYQIIFDKHFGKGVWEEFKKNYIEDKDNKKTFEQFIKTHHDAIKNHDLNPPNMISHAFVWKKSPEGLEYWSKISFKWDREIHTE